MSLTCFVSLQLINDKKALSERCEGVVAELKQVDQKYTKKISQMQQQHEMVRSSSALLRFHFKPLRLRFASSPRDLL